MIYLKSNEEVELLSASNLLVSRTLGELAGKIKPGITTLELDRIAEEYIRDHKGIPAFLGYKGFPKTLCTSVNSEVVHGIPSSYILKDGDIISIDCGVRLNGFYGDSAYTFEVGEVKDDVKRLLRITRESLYKGIEKALDGNRLGDISSEIQQYAENAGYSVVREMVGHGLGRNLHEEPEVPNYGKKGTGIRLQAGMVLCLEPMINMGTRYIIQEKDGWTIRTRDNQPSAHFELAVAIREKEPRVLSTFRFVEEVLHIV
jgi:methionyl aminopeptidase